MSYRKIIEQIPGKIVYESDQLGQVWCFFDDLCLCPVAGTVVEVPGKGALANRISALLYSKMGHMGIPHGYLGMRNMKESAFVSGATLPFVLKIHLAATPGLVEQFDLSGEVNFDPPLIEYRTHTNQFHATEDFLVAMGWTDHEEMEDIQGLMFRTVHCLQGLLAAWDIALMQIQLSVLRTYEDDLSIGGLLLPELMVLKDLRTQTIWDGFAMDNVEALMAMYYWLSQRMGVIVDEGPSLLPDARLVCQDAGHVNPLPPVWPDNVLPFAPPQRDSAS